MRHFDQQVAAVAAAACPRRRRTGLRRRPCSGDGRAASARPCATKLPGSSCLTILPALHWLPVSCTIATGARAFAQPVGHVQVPRRSAAQDHDREARHAPSTSRSLPRQLGHRRYGDVREIHHQRIGEEFRSPVRKLEHRVAAPDRHRARNRAADDRVALVDSLVALDERDRPPRIVAQLGRTRFLREARPIEAHLRDAGEAAVAHAGKPVFPVGSGQPAVRPLHRRPRPGPP